MKSVCVVHQLLLYCLSNISQLQDHCMYINPNFLWLHLHIKRTGFRLLKQFNFERNRGGFSTSLFVVRHLKKTLEKSALKAHPGKRNDIKCIYSRRVGRQVYSYNKDFKNITGLDFLIYFIFYFSVFLKLLLGKKTVMFKIMLLVGYYKQNIQQLRNAQRESISCLTTCVILK